MTNRAKRRTADLPHALGDVVGGCEELIALFIQEQVIITEMATRNVPHLP
jgi:hypothetical protein